MTDANDKNPDTSRNDAIKRAEELRRKLDAMSPVQDAVNKVKEGVKTAKSSADMIKETYDQTMFMGRVLAKGATVISAIYTTFDWAKEKSYRWIPFSKRICQAIGRQYEWYCCPREPFFPAVKRGIANSYNSNVNSIANLFRKEKIEFEPSELPAGKKSKTRIAIATLVTAFAAAGPVDHLGIKAISDWIPDPISDASNALIYEPPYDATVMGLTALFNEGSLHHGTIYTNGATEIDPVHNIWNVKACEFNAYCGSDDTLYFRIKPSVMHQIWSLATGHGWFLSDNVAAAVPNVPSKCEATTYSTRGRLSKGINFYPLMLNIKCEALPAPAVATPTAPAAK